eukprot:m51a1_g627 putative high affinity camp-specific and ibmx-insensitive 3 -cyclic phosphodiesterase 8b-like (934) ;mRNA; r:136955-141336
MKHKTMLRLKVALVEVSLGLFALACVVVAVITPWQMARNAGIVGVRAAADPLLRRVIEGARSEVLNFLWAAPTAALEAREVVAAPPNVTRDLRKLLNAGQRASRGTMSVRYACSVYTDGQMACIMFDKSTQTSFLQAVLLEGGNLTNQRMWECPKGYSWNESYPDGAFTDLGQYNASWYWPDDPLLTTGPHWMEEITVEVTGDESTSEYFVELLMLFIVPVLEDGRLVASIDGDFLLSTISEYLGSLELTQSARIWVVDKHGTVFGISNKEPVYKKVSDDTIIRGVDEHLMENAASADEPFFFENDEFGIMNIKVDGSSERVHYAVLPVRDSFNLNWTLIIAVKESDYTSTMLETSKSALLCGILIIVLCPLVVGVVFVAALRILFAASVLVGDSMKREMRTGMDTVLDILKQMKSGDLTEKQIQSSIGRVMDAISSGLYKLDMQNTVMDSYEERFIKEEFLPEASARGDKYLSMEDLAKYSRIATPQERPLWNWNVFDHGNCFHSVCMEQLCRFEVAAILDVPERTLHEFVSKIEKMYVSDNPYHNSMHAADVTQAMAYLLTVTEVPFKQLEKAALILTAIVHDVGHPGRNNTFQVNTRSPLAMQYNDRSVLENFHISSAFNVLAEVGVLAGLDEQAYRSLRCLMIELVLATDMAFHFRIVSEFKTVTLCESLSDEARVTVMKLMMKLSDAANLARPLAGALEWSNRVQEEFFLQGDDEKGRGLQVSANMDRDSACLPRLQASFIRFIGLPMFQAFNDFMPIPEVMDNLRATQQHWQAETNLMSTRTTVTPAHVANENSRKRSLEFLYGSETPPGQPPLVNPAELSSQIVREQEAAAALWIGPLVTVAVNAAMAPLVARMDNQDIRRRNRHTIRAVTPAAAGIAFFPATYGEVQGLTAAQLQVLSIFYNDDFGCLPRNDLSSRISNFAAWLT